MNKYVFSLNSKTPARITSKPLIFKQNLIAANIVNNNFPDIRNLTGNQLSKLKTDLLIYSFPCQGLSIANMGRDKGINSKTSTSNLIWQIHRILKEIKNDKNNLPKYLLMENVQNLTSKKHIKDYQKWIEFLTSLGYNTKTMILDGADFGSVQNRKRLFAISILNWNNTLADQEFLNYFKKRHQNKLNIEQRAKKYQKIISSSNSYLDEIEMSTPNKTKSRIRMSKTNLILNDLKTQRENNFLFKTLTTKQDRHPNIGMIKLEKKHYFKGKLNYRFITPREAYLIMGFAEHDFNKVKTKYDEKIITKESLYRQAGNSIVVNVLEGILNFILDFKGDNYD